VSTLRLIVDQLLSPVPGGIGRYAAELSRAVAESTPTGWSVEGVVAAASPEELAGLKERIPGLDAVAVTSLRRRELAVAWQLGLASLGGDGPVHSMSVLAPLSRRQRRAGPIVSTIHDAVPWTHPETLTPRGVSFHVAMAKRAERFADAIVVPTKAVADELNGILDLGDRVRVIGSAVSSRFSLPPDADQRAATLRLPGGYLLAVGTLEPRKGLEPLVRSLALAGATDLPLLVVGGAGWGGVDLATIAAAAGLPEGRVRSLGHLADEDLATAVSRATIFVQPSLAEGFGIPVLEAMSLGTPVIHSDAPALVEVAGGAGICVAREPAADYPRRLAEAIAAVAADEAERAVLSAAGIQRSKAFSWQRSAAAVWTLHTELAS